MQSLLYAFVCFESLIRYSAFTLGRMSSNMSPSVNGSIEKHLHILGTHVAPLTSLTYWYVVCRWTVSGRLGDRSNSRCICWCVLHRDLCYCHRGHEQVTWICQSKYLLVLSVVWTTVTVCSSSEANRFQLLPHVGSVRGYLIKESGFGYIVNSNPDSVNSYSVNKSESGFGFHESCLNPVLLATWRRWWVLTIINDLRKTSIATTAANKQHLVSE